MAPSAIYIWNSSRFPADWPVSTTTWGRKQGRIQDFLGGGEEKNGFRQAWTSFSQILYPRLGGGSKLSRRGPCIRPWRKVSQKERRWKRKKIWLISHPLHCHLIFIVMFPPPETTLNCDWGWARRPPSPCVCHWDGLKGSLKKIWGSFVFHSKKNSEKYWKAVPGKIKPKFSYIQILALP